ncbi:tetratricopeptide repeat protein [Sanguibacter sp. 4.1]|uniref:Tetratricopeptide repeat protein n=1 Tax=Sanguibacter biliveldensis TaxID=3030830 RepID=A0AAF0Z155_9MICO|nr:tetratricopeptide repeat protein [Sanguibacter sp. 4.1]WPF80862.1 tetratricopeptide repeat protein [Sanguibacter sp. 4.1]
MAVDWTLLAAKAVGPAVGKLSISTWKRIAYSWTLPLKLRKASSAEFIELSKYWTLRKQCQKIDFVRAFRSGSPKDIEQLASDLQADLGAGPVISSAEEAKLLVGALISIHTQMLPAHQALETQVRTAVAELKLAIRQASPQEADDYSLQVAPLRRRQLETLLETWHAFPRFLGELSTASSNQEALKAWNSRRPPWWKDAPTNVTLWIAEIAGDAALPTISADLIEEAIADGATRVDYWEARAAVLRSGNTGEEQLANLLPLAGKHALMGTIIHFLQGNFIEAQSSLCDWTSLDESESSYRNFIECQVFAAKGDLGKTEELAMNSLENEGLTRNAIVAVNALLDNGRPRQNQVHLANLRRAQTLSVRSRDTERRWGQPSVMSTLLAIESAIYAGDTQTAWTLTQLTPDGTATFEEHNDSRIQEYAALIAIEIRPLEEATLQVLGIRDPLKSSEAEALLAMRRGELTEAEGLWRAAIEYATSEEEEYRFAQQISILGGEISGSELRLVDHAELRNLNLISQAAREVTGAFQQLRNEARRDRNLTFAFLAICQHGGKHEEAAKAMAESAQYWNDSVMWEIAAREYDRSSNPALAASCARTAWLSSSRPKSHNIHLLHLQIESYSSIRDWKNAASASAELMALTPDSPDAIWCLTICLMELTRYEEAWNTYQKLGNSPAPRSERETLALIHLSRHEEKSLDSVERILLLAESESASETVKAAAVYSILMRGPEAVSPAPDAQERVAVLLAQVPHVFESVPVNLEDPMATLDAIVASSPDTSEIDREVFLGTYPLGLASSVHGRGYAETLVAWAGPRFSGNPNSFEREVQQARELRSQRVAIDTSSFLSLAQLDKMSADKLLGYFDAPVRSLAQAIDAASAVDSFRPLSTMTVGRGGDGSARVHTISEEEARALLDRAKNVSRLILGTHGEHSEAAGIFDTLSDNGVAPVWLSALSLSINGHSVGYMSDDAVLRKIASDKGSASISTSAVIEAALRDGHLDKDEAILMQASLIRAGCVGGVFREDWLRVAVEIDSWLPKGGSLQIAWAPDSTNPTSLVGAALEFAGHCAANPAAISAWVHALAEWVARTSGESAQNNVNWLLTRILDEDWLTQTALPFVLDGIRQAIGERDLEDPLEHALRIEFERLSNGLTHQVAAMYVQGLVSLSTPADKSVANMVILTT